MGIQDICTIDQFSIVLLGSFNPAIFHPEWFDRNQILPPQEVRDIAEAKRKDSDDLEGVKVRFIGSNVFVSGAQTRISLPSYMITVSPDRFEVSTQIQGKYEELAKFVAAIFMILEHTPIDAIGINFTSSLRFSESPKDLMSQYFCNQPDALNSVFGENYTIDSKITYTYDDSNVTLALDSINEGSGIGIKFNYHRDFADKDSARDVIKYVLDCYQPMMLNANGTITGLFGEPVDGEAKNEDKPS